MKTDDLRALIKSGPWKFTNAGGTAIYGRGKWSLPRGARPGKWMPYVERLEPCDSGYHVIERPDALLNWIGPELYVCEVRGERVEKNPGVGIYHEARLVRRVETWNDKTARLFAADCAERVARLDKTGTAAQTIEVARRYARGQATKKELNAARAAGAAARDAAWAAARDAASAAARAAGDDASDSAVAAAVAAAWAAARDAARDAAWDARDTERRWQSERLMKYLTGEVGND